MNTITPREIARNLAVTPLQLRNWLRDKWRAGDPRLAHHRFNERWLFSPDLAAELEREYRVERGQPIIVLRDRRSSKHSDVRASTGGRVAGTVRGRLAPRFGAAPGHRVAAEWQGEQIETLADLLRPGLTAVVVGTNPAPESVAAGHYWQGRTGQTLWRRLRAVGMLPESAKGYEDDAAFAAGVGFTDVVKRPSARADDVTEAELGAGRRILEKKLTELEVPLVIFAFKKAATTLLGSFEGNGFLDPHRHLAASRIFVMPGPYEATATAQPTLETLAEWASTSRPRRASYFPRK